MNSLKLIIALTVFSVFTTVSCTQSLVLRQVPVKDVCERFQIQYNRFLELTIESFNSTKSKKVKVVSSSKTPLNEYWVDEYSYEGKVVVRQNCYKIMMQSNLFFEGDVEMMSELEYQEELNRINFYRSSSSENGAVEFISELNTGTPFKTWKHLKKGDSYTVKGHFTLKSSDGKVVDEIEGPTIEEFEVYRSK